MPQISLKSAEFKSIIKTFNDFATHSFRKSGVLSLTVNPELRLVSTVDTSTVICSPKTARVINREGSNEFHLDIGSLASIKLPGDEVTIAWNEYPGPFQIKDSRTTLNLKLAVGRPNFDRIPTKFEETIVVPLEIMVALTKYCELPYSYFKGKSELAPIRIFEKNGKLHAGTDDGYSLAEVATNCDAPAGMDYKIPFYVLKSLYANVRCKGDDKVKLNRQGYSYFLSNGVIGVYLNGLNENTQDFDKTFSGIKSWFTTCEFAPDKLLGSVEPLASLLSSKDTSGAIIVAEFRKSGLSLSMRHNEKGTAEVSNADGILSIENEDLAQVVSVNLHPKAFLDYTDILKKHKTKMTAGSRAILYSCDLELDGTDINVKYLYPTVQV